MKRIIALLIFTSLTLSLGFAAGLDPWEFNMSKAQVSSFKKFGPYKSFSNGDLETYSRRFHGGKANVQFFFQHDRLRRIGVYLFEGTDPKEAIPAWRRAYAALQKDYGRVIVPDIVDLSTKKHIDDAGVIAIGAAINADVTGETKMAPAKQPPKMHVFARFWTGMVQGTKWYYIAVFYDANP